MLEARYSRCDNAAPTTCVLADTGCVRPKLPPELTPPSPGHTLQESLDELIQMLSPALALRVLIQFDKSINNALATRVKTKLHFKVVLLCLYL